MLFRSLSQRLFKAQFEMKFEDRFDITLVNEDLETSLKKAQEMVDIFLAKDVQAVKTATTL